MDTIQHVNAASETVVDLENPEDPQALRKYVNLKLAVTRQLQFLERLFQMRSRKHQESSCRQILTKLAEDRFTLAVVGQFKRGKSSLINALIGSELLSTGLLPLTSAITILRFGVRPRLVIRWMNSSLEDEKPVSALPEFVTEQGNPGNRKQIRAVYVENMSPFLRRGVELVDTPGIGSAIEANTATTEAFIPQCDAVIFVTSVDTPMTESEREFLRRLRHDVKKIFCVVNKIDLLPEPQLFQVMEFVRSQIKSCLGPEALIFSVSAHCSLSPTVNHENDADSVAALRNALGEFLAAERRDILLRVVVERSLRLLALEQTDISAACSLVTATEAIREAKKTSIQADFNFFHNAAAHCIESLTARLCGTIENIGTADLQRHMDAAVATCVNDAIDANMHNRWKPARRVLSNIAQLAAPAAERILRQWLAERQAATLDEIRCWPATVLQAINQTATNALMFVEKAELLPMSPDDSGIFPGAMEPHLLYPQSDSWTFAAPLWMRYLPMISIRRPLRHWLGRQTLEHTSKLRLMAVEQLRSFITAQITEFRKRVDTALWLKEKNLIADIVVPSGGQEAPFHASLQEQEQTARRIQEALTSLLASVTGQTDTIDRVIPAQDGKSLKPQAVTDIFSITISNEEVLESLRFAGCPVCRRLKRTIFEVLATWQYRISVDDATQQWFARSLGFCPLHTWQMASISSPQGLSRGYPSLTKQLASSLRAVDCTDENVTSSIRKLLASSSSCALCRLSAQAESQCLQCLAAIVESGVNRQRYSASRGVCLRHLPGLLALVKSTSVKRLILDEAAGHLAALSEDMQSFTLKHGALRRQLINDNEEIALPTALEKVAGYKFLCLPWQFDEFPG
ncbi:MAG: dynamin family protein [Phycisphaerae bacterium]